MSADTLRYAGFWSRLGAALLDGIVTWPLLCLYNWGNSQSRLFEFYYLIPGFLFWIFFDVYLVKRFGGTPGKLLMGIWIRKVNGDPVGYREATIRCLPDIILSFLASVASLVALSQMSDATYFSLSVAERVRQLGDLAPGWSQPLGYLSIAWAWGELIVLLTNHKRRAIHDFIAGTVVVHVTPKAGLVAVPLAA